MTEELMKAEPTIPEAEAEIQVSIPSTILPIFHPIIREHGLEIFTLVMNTGVAGEAARRLAEAAQGQRRAGELNAVRILAECFNAISAALITRAEWTQEQLTAVDQAIQLAFQGQLTVAEPPRILLSDPPLMPIRNPWKKWTSH